MIIVTLAMCQALCYSLGYNVDLDWGSCPPGVYSPGGIETNKQSLGCGINAMTGKMQGVIGAPSWRTNVREKFSEATQRKWALSYAMGNE